MKKLTLFIVVLILNSTFFIFNSCAQYTMLHSFDGANGTKPLGSLFSDGNFLYGMAKYGGTNDLGIIFKIKPDGTGYAKLLDFDGASNGKNPEHDQNLISDGTFLYGMTAKGGTNNQGTIFKIKPDGTGYFKLLDFSGMTNGSFPHGSLISDGTFLYGMTSSGGWPGDGTIFKIKTDGSGYFKLLDFNPSTANGQDPEGSLIFIGTSLYGMTAKGGVYNQGIIFKINMGGTGYAPLLDFKEPNGSSPLGSLISDGTFLYGMTADGGTYNHGTIFKIKPDGTGYSVLRNFNPQNGNGNTPNGSLIFVGDALYGMTLGFHGNIFKIMPDGTGYSVLLRFTGANGNNPLGSLISDGTFLYGMASEGIGMNDYGLIFKLDIASSTQQAMVQSSTHNPEEIATANTKQGPTQEGKGIYFQNDSLAKILAKIKSERKDIFIPGNKIAKGIIQYLRKAAGMSMNQQAEEYFSAHPKVDSNIINWQVIFNFSDSVSVKSPVFKYLISNRKKFYLLYTIDTVDMIIREIYCSAMNRCLISLPSSEIDTTGYKVLRTELKALKLPSADRLISGMDILLYENTQNWQQYAKTVVMDIENYRSNDFEVLNHYAFAFFEHVNNPAYLMKALEWAKKANELKANDPAILDTYASLLAVNGKKKEAIKIEKQALEIVKAHPEDSDPGWLTEFAKKITEWSK